MGEWKEYKLGDVALTVTSGGTPKSSEPSFYNGNIPWLNTKEINFNRINKTEKYITEKGLQFSSAKWIPKYSIIVAMYGATAGKVAYSLIDLTTNQACCNIVIDNKKAVALYVYYYLQFSYNDLKNLACGAAQQNLNINVISNYSIILPPLSEQKRIASILGSLDDKIDLLHRENETLEAMAETLFRKWFIEDAKDEWEEKSLACVSDITAGGDKPKIFSKYITSECTIPVYSNGIDNEGLYGYTNIPKIYKESITVSARGTIGYVVLRRSPYVPIVRLISLIPKDNIVTAKWLYLYLKQLNINGTGTTQQQLTIPDFCSRTIILPPFEIIKKFTNIIDNLYDKQLINKEEISCIEKMKNCLLKKLMHNK